MALTKAEFEIVNGNKIIPVHFNPSEYRLSTREPGVDMDQKPYDRKEEFLTFTLYFDTYMEGDSLLGGLVTKSDPKDVRSVTDAIAGLAEREKGKNALVIFRFGSLQFKGFVSAVEQRFTMFMDDGRPVRAVLEVTMRRSDEAQLQSITQDSEAGADKANLVKSVRNSGMEIENIRSLLDG